MGGNVMLNYGKNINYYLVDGVPSGRIKCTIANWTGVVYRIPRADLERCKDRHDLTQSGVYLLFGTSNETGEDVVYVGQADVRKKGSGILERLQEHKRNHDKDYWKNALAFTTSNDFLGATEISWLENHFCVLAKAANRYEVKNGNEPSPGKPKEEIISDLEDFAVYAKIVTGVLGYKVFEPKVSVAETTDTPADDNELFYIKRNNLDAKGKRTNDGFAVFAGSRIALSVADHVSRGLRAFREKNANVIDENGVLREDVSCDSPSAASVFVIGKSSNGLTEWKTSAGKTLKEVEANE
jgi:hypothetical protein